MNIFDYFILFLLMTALGSLIFWLGPYERWAARKRDKVQAEYTKEWMKSYNDIREWHLARWIQNESGQPNSKNWARSLQDELNEYKDNHE